ncbi:MAG: immunity 26/phosphotriesterase HocA family protein [Clostridia bacterium]|nr:immunity 26/phosphotriesterase HocA family protein [Clostridia bacterium]
MYQLTNAQRRCFALAEAQKNWTLVRLKASRYDDYETYAYLDGDTIKKCILVSDVIYVEMEYNEALSADHMRLLPKTDRGKPVLLSSANLLKRANVGMCLSYARGHIALYSANTARNYFTTDYDRLHVDALADFQAWVATWCRETTANDVADINAFLAANRRHVKYKEGDVFRFKINRRLYGYGRILVDYPQMRRKKEKFWDILMGTALVCSVYHIVTEDPHVSVEELRTLPSLPSAFVADNRIYYGEDEIIGHIPIGGNEDYPIMYGASINAREWDKKIVNLQIGKNFYSRGDVSPIFGCGDCRHNGVAFSLNVDLPVLLRCIEAHSNAPYWASDRYYVQTDLRNPIYAEKLALIRRQFGLPADALN